jgi:hypothetical protein
MTKIRIKNGSEDIMTKDLEQIIHKLKIIFELIKLSHNRDTNCEFFSQSVRQNRNDGRKPFLSKYYYTGCWCEAELNHFH